MCLAIPGKVKDVKGHKATIAYPGESHFAMVGDEKIKKGDYVLVQMGIIVKKLTSSEARQSLRVWQ